MDALSLEHALKSQGLKPVYIVHGPEPFLRVEALRALKRQAEREKADVTEPEVAAVEITRLLDDLRTPSMFASRKMIVLDGAEDLFLKHADLLAQYAARPGTHATLALAAETLNPKPKKKSQEDEEDASTEVTGPATGRRNNPAGRKKAMEALLRSAVVVDCPLLKEWRIKDWCAQRARAHGKSMDGPAAQMLAELGGTNLGHLDGQIQALAALCRDKPRITIRDVEQLVGSDHLRAVWDLVRQVGKGETAGALRTLERLLRQPGVGAPWIIGALARQSRDLWVAAEMDRRGISQAEVARRLGKDDWIVKRLIEAVRSLGPERIRENNRLILRADIDLKTTAAPDEWILQSLVIRMCGGEKRAAVRKA